jgi:osmotically-inducible protein OsmY
MEDRIMEQLKRFSAIVVAMLMLSVLGCASGGKQESTGQYLDDSVITTKVKAAILEDPKLKVTEIKVETYKGVVQLSGFVSSRDSMDHAVQVARGVQGVKSVKNDMQLR